MGLQGIDKGVSGLEKGTGGEETCTGITASFSVLGGWRREDGEPATSGLLWSWR